MLIAQAQDIPATGQWDPQGSGGVTELRREGNHNLEFVPNPSQSRAMDQTVGNSRFKGIRLLGFPDAWVAASKSAKHACATLPASPLPVAHAHCKALGAMASASGRLRKGVGFLP